MYEFTVRLLADASVIVIVLVGTFVLIKSIPNVKKYQAYARVLMAGLTAYLAAKLIGGVYQPAVERPFEIAGTVPGASYLDNPGFPSDHALFAMAIVLAVWLEARRPRVAAFLFILTVLMGVGRVLALVHSPLDVVGGIVIASLGAVWYLPVRSRVWRLFAIDSQKSQK